MISIENIEKDFGGQALFDRTGFQINKRERVGLVGRNGHGKTTLFKMIIGEIYPDAGKIVLPRYYRVGYVQQHLEFSHTTVLQEAAEGLREDEKDQEWKAEKILAGLGFSKADLSRSPHEFSGGYQVRLNLAKVLISEPDLLLLDEPTNYLDVVSIRWIERFLCSWRHELLLITHDRGFMDKVITHTVGIHRKKMRKIAGNTQKYYTQIAADEEIYEKTRQNDAAKRKEVELFINRFRAKARLANLVQSRIKTLSKMEKKNKLESMKTLDFSFRSAPIQSKYVVTVNHLSFSYDDRQQLIEDLSFSVGQQDRIFIVGKNGKGKTTLLKLLSDALAPQQGDIEYRPQIMKGVYEQSNVNTLVDSRTVVEELLYSHPDVSPQLARNIAGSMMFEQDAALKKISVLSGGEKARVMLGKLLATPANLLLLDEPTNHLDMDSCDALLAAIDNFEGAVIMVTHNEIFLKALSQKLIVFKDDRVYFFDGSYGDFLNKEGWGDDTGKKKASAGQVATKKELRRQRAKIPADRSKKIQRMEKKIAALEDDIHTLERKEKELTDQLVDASTTRNVKKITALSQKHHACKRLIDQRFAELETITTQLEKTIAE